MSRSRGVRDGNTRHHRMSFLRHWWASFEHVSCCL